MVSEGRQFDGPNFQLNYRPGETRQCIVLNGIGDAFLEVEDMVFDDVTYGGGGAAEQAQRRVPRVAGEYFEAGAPPAYGLYARNVRGLTLKTCALTWSSPT